MGRWGTGNLQSDTSQDHLYEILCDIVKDFVFRLASYHHQLFDSRWYPGTILGAVVVLTRLSEHYKMVAGFSYSAVAEWSEIYLRLYDTEKALLVEPGETPYLNLPHLAVLRREDVVTVFARLERLALKWASHWKKDLVVPDEIPPVPETLEKVLSEEYMLIIINRLVNDITVNLAPENIEDFFDMGGLDRVRTDMDILIFLGTAYQTGIGRNAPAIRYWRDTLLKRFDEFALIVEADPDPSYIEEWTFDDERQIIADTFDQLEALVRQYPNSMDWYGEDNDSPPYT